MSCSKLRGMNPSSWEIRAHSSAVSVGSPTEHLRGAERLLELFGLKGRSGEEPRRNRITWRIQLRSDTSRSLER
jgi:hypothetical protein